MGLSITHPNHDESQGILITSRLWAPRLPQGLALLGIPVALLVVLSLQFLVELTPWAMASLTLCVILLGVSAYVLATLGPPPLVSLEVDAVAQECEVRVGATAWLSAQSVRFSPPQVDSVAIELDGIEGQRARRGGRCPRLLVEYRDYGRRTWLVATLPALRGDSLGGYCQVVRELSDLLGLGHPYFTGGGAEATRFGSRRMSAVAPSTADPGPHARDGFAASSWVCSEVVRAWRPGDRVELHRPGSLAAAAFAALLLLVGFATCVHSWPSGSDVDRERGWWERRLGLALGVGAVAAAAWILCATRSRSTCLDWRTRTWVLSRGWLRRTLNFSRLRSISVSASPVRHAMGLFGGTVHCAFVTATWLSRTGVRSCSLATTQPFHGGPEVAVSHALPMARELAEALDVPLEPA